MKCAGLAEVFSEFVARRLSGENVEIEVFRNGLDLDIELAALPVRVDIECEVEFAVTPYEGLV